MATGQASFLRPSHAFRSLRGANAAENSYLAAGFPGSGRQAPLGKRPGTVHQANAKQAAMDLLFTIAIVGAVSYFVCMWFLNGGRR